VVVKVAAGKIATIGIVGAVLKFSLIAAELLEKATRPAGADSATTAPAVHERTAARANRTQIDEGSSP
jgi:hypothetical protein